MHLQDYQILDQHSDEQVWWPSQLLAHVPHLCMLSAQPHILCSPRWQITPFAPTSIAPDISIILLFTFYQPVFYATYDQNFHLRVKRGLATGLALGSILVMP